VLTNDTGGPSAKTVTAVSGNTNDVGNDVPGQFGTFHINSDGTYTYTLDDANPTVNNLNNGDTLTDSINYTVSSGLSSDVGTLTITIHGHTDGP
jgi:VCBS repeat-containing protein